ncbi:hypothetical protein VV02_17975 [Luteipulveratus mongoliensis]|uniref:Uncharacterized protein n=1 Tax=Luteipulveratus mongoliensis TaxID=571913 RepID=A0A0K1JQR1_9MICO|nr:hypothetical protein VV02_17975 [Luteipulveratus mongoliensis]
MALDRGDALDDVAVALAQRCGTATGEQIVVSELGAQLHQGVLRAWDGGWQPADVHRLAVRRLAPAEQELLADVMVDQLAGYATATVDRRWHAQLADISRGSWWPRSQSLLQAHRHRGSDWLMLLTRTLTVLHLLLQLPRIERLTPLPGTARPDVAVADRQDRPAVDERILARVRQLLAKAESTTFEAEAETFTAGAQSLMARHSIDAALVAAADEVSGHEGHGPGGRRIGVDNPYDGQKAMLLTAVAQVNRCQVVWSQQLGFATVVGFEVDADAVELLYTSLLVQATQAMTAAGKRTDARGRSRTRSFRSSFLSAYAMRIGERLQEAADAAVAAAQADPVGEPERPGEASIRPERGALVRVLADRDQDVRQAVDTLFPQVKKSGPRPARDAEGWHSGRSAADRARLSSADELRSGGRDGRPDS